MDDQNSITLNSMKRVLEIALIYNDKKLREIVEGMVEKMSETVAKCVKNEPELEHIEKENFNYFS